MNRGQFLSPAWRFGLLSLLLCVAPVGRADTPSDEEAPSKPASNQGIGITLGECRQIALANQPTIAATRAAYKAACDRVAALETIRVPNCLARDLPIRKRQANLGVTIAQGGIVQAEAETLHGVTVGYLGALYAGQQLRLTEDPKQGIRHRLKNLKRLVEDKLTGKQPRRDITLEEHRALVESFLHTLNGRVSEAEQGQRRALAALHEAMGVSPDCGVVLPERDLPCPRVQLPPLCELIALALARRGEMIQANVFVEVVRLEIDAQASSGRSTMRTFASSSDIHAKPLPSGDLGGLNFRPAIVGPDMPAFLNGCRDARVQQAHDYLERAQALAVKTRNLIALEVEDLYRQWVDKSTKADELEKAHTGARTFADALKVGPQRGTYPNVDEVINAGLIATRLQLEWKDAGYQSLLVLAALERATAGGFAVDFDAAPDCHNNGKPENKELTPINGN